MTALPHLRCWSFLHIVTSLTGCHRSSIFYAGCKTCRATMSSLWVLPPHSGRLPATQISKCPKSWRRTPNPCRLSSAHNPNHLYNSIVKQRTIQFQFITGVLITSHYITRNYIYSLSSDLKKRWWTSAIHRHKILTKKLAPLHSQCQVVAREHWQLTLSFVNHSYLTRKSIPSRPLERHIIFSKTQSRNALTKIPQCEKSPPQVRSKLTLMRTPSSYAFPKPNTKPQTPPRVSQSAPNTVHLFSHLQTFLQ